MAKSNVKQRSCCFTGHRPEKLTRSEEDIRSGLRRLILEAIDDGYDVFISGMARGVDIWAAEEVLRLRESGYGIKLVCAVAFEGMEESWGAFWKSRYSYIILNSDINCSVCRESSKKAYIDRNKWMVDRSSRVIAVFNGSSGGTARTVEYAKEADVDICYV